MYLQDILASKIVDELKLDENQYEIISYGAFAFIQIIISIVAVALFGYIFDVMFEALLVSLSTSILRQYSGGVHASKPVTCQVIGTIVSVGLASLSRYISIVLNFPYSFGILPLFFLLSFYIIYKNAPVDSEAKPIRTEIKRKKMKKISSIIVFAYLSINIVFFLLYLYTSNTSYYVFCLDICGGMIFQIFSLTIIGHKVLVKVDNGVTHILYRR